jgi:hypothetical protein
MTEFHQIRRLHALRQFGLLAFLALGAANVLLTIQTLAHL